MALAGVCVGAAAALSGCAGLPGADPLQVSIAGVEGLPGQGLELRLLVKLRVLNPNTIPVDYDGVYVEMDVRSGAFATGVSDAKGSVPRYGEAVLAVPVTVSALSLLRQALAATGGSESTALTYRLRGKLGGVGLVSHRFETSGELSLSTVLGGGAPARRS